MTRNATAAPADSALEAGKVTGGAEMSRVPPDSATETADSGPESLWRRAGVPPAALVWPVTTPRKNGLRGLLGRLRESNSGEGPEISGNGPKFAAPANLRPWTWEVLPHVSETREGGPLTRLMDRIAWHATPPDSRYVLHAERVRRRRESLVAWALVRFAALVARRPSGPPPWLVDDRRDDGT